MEGASDHSVGIDDVGHARSAQPETAFNVVKTPYLPCSIAPKTKRSSNGLTEALNPVDAVGTNPDDDRITGGEIIMGLAESPDLGGASRSKGAKVKEENDITASVL